MVQPTQHLRFQVVTILSPSVELSKQAAKTLASWTGLSSPKATTENNESDELDELFCSSLRRYSFQSTTLTCPNSDAMLHWIASSTTRPSNQGRHEILAVHQANSIQQARRKLAAACRGNATFKTKLKVWLNRTLDTSDFLGKGRLPVIDVETEGDESVSGAAASKEVRHPRHGVLKEIVIPFYEDCTHPDGSSMTQALSERLPSPVAGLYQTPSGVCIRPIPAGEHDRHLAAPSLVFHSNDTEDARISAALLGKIGFCGLGGSGQLMARHPSLHGLDIRFSSGTQYVSMFAEAQESLLAGSLDELQSTHVLGGKTGEMDPRIEKMDCWVEFRANISNPRGFVRGNREPRTAKAPDLPYE